MPNYYRTAARTTLGRSIQRVDALEAQTLRAMARNVLDESPGYVADHLRAVRRAAAVKRCSLGGV